MQILKKKKKVSKFFPPYCGPSSKTRKVKKKKKKIKEYNNVFSLLALV